MKEPSDINGLFSFFNPAEEKNYREINQGRDLDAARERWPIFARRPAEPSPLVSRIQPSSPPPISAALQNPEPSHNARKPQLSSVFGRISRPTADTQSVAEPDAAAQETQSPSMQSLFNRLRQS